MDYFVNTEYIDLERRIDLISLGLVAADGREFYAISTEFDQAPANEFVRTVVIPQLEPHDDHVWMSRTAMKDALIEFIGDDQPTFWSWAALPWDWMCMAQLFPLEQRVPDGWRYTAYDVSLLAEAAGMRLNPVDARLPQSPAAAHHALADARWVRDTYRVLTSPSMCQRRTSWPANDLDGRPVRDFVIDAEFIESDDEIDLVSLAVVAADGAEFYAVAAEHDPTAANPFVRSNVLPKLEPAGHPAWMSRAAIRQGLLDFIGDAAPRFWSWGGLPYDWLVIAQLFDVEERVPDGWRYTGYDLTQLAAQQGFRIDPVDDQLPPFPDNGHHALADARWAREVLTALTPSGR
ncbi:MAG TPA: 3'-5' exoribonuclease [Microlunatus sp.]